jgi:hypothetical protein
MRQQAERALRDTRTELATLPRVVTTEPALYVLYLATTFSTAFAQYAEGTPGSAQVVQAHRAAFGRFKRAVRGTAPNFVPFTAAADVPSHWYSSDSSPDENGVEDKDVADRLDQGRDDMDDDDSVSEHDQKAIYLSDVCALMKRLERRPSKLCGLLSLSLF